MSTNFYSPTKNANVFADLSNEAGYVDSCELRGTTTLPTDTDLFSKGCFLKIENNGATYVNTAADGQAPSWVATGSGGLSSTLTSAHIFVGNGSNVATDVAVSGDLTLANTGAFTIANDAVTTAKILNANVTKAKLATGISASHIIKFAGQPTTVGGAAAEAFTVTGALNTDLAFVQMVDNGTNNVTIVDAVVTADTLTVTFSGDPGADTVINYQIIRATA